MRRAALAGSRCSVIARCLRFRNSHGPRRRPDAGGSTSRTSRACRAFLAACWPICTMGSTGHVHGGPRSCTATFPAGDVVMSADGPVLIDWTNQVRATSRARIAYARLAKPGPWTGATPLAASTLIVCRR